jgi:hypothetical protein
MDTCLWTFNERFLLNPVSQGTKEALAYMSHGHKHNGWSMGFKKVPAFTTAALASCCYAQITIYTQQ